MPVWPLPGAERRACSRVQLPGRRADDHVPGRPPGGGHYRWPGSVPKALSVEYLQRHHEGKLPAGLLRALTPGAADAWFTALARYGTMRFGDVVAPTIELAERGFPMYAIWPQQCRRPQKTYRRYPGNAAVFLPNAGRQRWERCSTRRIWRRRWVTSWQSRSRTALKVVSKLCRRPGMLVYKGDLAEKIVTFCQEEGAC